MHERPAGARSPQAAHSLSLVRVNLGFTPKLIEPSYDRVRTLPLAEKKKRRGRDSNPGWGSLPITIFETVPFNRSGTPPRLRQCLHCVKIGVFFTPVEIEL